jgi:hypothetical protein
MLKIHQRRSVICLASFNSECEQLRSVKHTVAGRLLFNYAGVVKIIEIQEVKKRDERTY